MSKVTGKVAQIVGPVIDVEFGSEVELPKIYDSLEIARPDGSTLVLEVQSHIGEDTVRTIAMDSSDGLSRGVEVVATGAPIQMPIGEDVYGNTSASGDASGGLYGAGKFAYSTNQQETSAQSVINTSGSAAAGSAPTGSVAARDVDHEPDLATIGSAGADFWNLSGPSIVVTGMWSKDIQIEVWAPGRQPAR